MELKYLNEIEKKYGLLDVNVDGYRFWNYLRAEVGWQYVKKQMDYEVKSTGEPAARKRKSMGEILRLIGRSRLGKEKCDLLVLNHPRKSLVDSFYECIYTDEIIQQIENTVVLEQPYQGIHYEPVKTKRLVYTDIVDFYSYILCSLYRVFRPKSYGKNIQTMLKTIEQPIRELNRVYGVEVKPEEFTDSLNYGLYMYKAERYYYKRVIAKLKPRAILEVVSYDRKCMVVNEIAAERGIPTIELQHGTIGEEHIAYNFAEGSRVEQFPEYIFLFSDYWKSKAKFPIKEENRLAVGYPYLERMAEKARLQAKKPEKKNILFLSSGPIGDKLAHIAVELGRLLDKEEYHLIFKLHPKEYAIWKENYPVLLDTPVEVIDHNRRNLYELYAISDIQVSGFNSTTVFEGLYFSLETYILDYCASREIDDLCKSGAADYFRTAGELAEKIVRKEKHSNQKLGNMLWKENSLENAVREINRIMGKGVGK